MSDEQLLAMSALDVWGIGRDDFVRWVELLMNQRDTARAEVERLQDEYAQLGEQLDGWKLQCERLRGALERIVEGDDICDDCDAEADPPPCGSCEIGLTTSGMASVARAALAGEVDDAG